MVHRIGLTLGIAVGALCAAMPQYDNTYLELSHTNGLNFSDIDGQWMYRGSYGSPTFADFNGDGKKDLLLGFMGITMGATGGGYLNVYLNEGTAEAPQFKLGKRAPFSVSGG